MNLRRQLLIVGLLLLSLPWAGCQFAREMEGALRQGQAQALQATANAVAAVLRDQPALLYPNPDRRNGITDDRPSIYARPREEAIIVDGYADGWDDVPPRHFGNVDNPDELSLSYRAITQKDKLYLLIQVQDASVIYHNPGLSREPNGDRLVIRTWQANRRQDYVIATAAPGKVRARHASPVGRGISAERIRGQWQDSALGYTLELELPLSATGGRLGFYIIDTTARTGARKNTMGNITSLDATAPPWLIYTPTSLRNAIAPFSQNGQTLEVIDTNYWRVADNATAKETGQRQVDPARPTFWLLRKLYRSILAQDEVTTRPLSPTEGKVRGEEIDRALGGTPDNKRYQDPSQPDRTVLAAASPITDGQDIVGVILIEESAEQYLSLTDQAFTRLLGYSLLVLSTGILGLLGYASILSWRIRSLSQAATNATNGRNSAIQDFPRSRAPDEIGELSRSYADLLAKLNQYNHYLRGLSRKLSHELRTPIAVIQTSLENLERGNTGNTGDKVYLQRARDGLARLANILNAMSEANSLEESIRQNPLEKLDLVPLLKEVVGAYEVAFEKHLIRLDCQPESAQTLASADLLVQALDKLMDNAASFCLEGEEIVVQLVDGGDSWSVSVINEGPQLPEQMQAQLLNSMVSVRDGRSNDVHMGLGLHIVNLIAEYHGALLHLDNREDGNGVICTLSLAKAESPVE